MPVGISGLPASSAPSLECVRQKEYQGKLALCNSLGSEVPSWSAFFSGPFRVFLCSFYIEYPGVSVVLSGRNREKYINFIFREAEVSYFIFVTMLMLILIYLSICISL